MHYFIDTNVAAMANKKSDTAPARMEAAALRLLQLQQHEILTLDDAFHILSEYDRSLHSVGQPGVNDAFTCGCFATATTRATAGQ